MKVWRIAFYFIRLWEWDDALTADVLFVFWLLNPTECLGLRSHAYLSTLYYICLLCHCVDRAPYTAGMGGGDFLAHIRCRQYAVFQVSLVCETIEIYSDRAVNTVNFGFQIRNQVRFFLLFAYILACVCVCVLWMCLFDANLLGERLCIINKSENHCKMINDHKGRITNAVKMYYSCCKFYKKSCFFFCNRILIEYELPNLCLKCELNW